jgi:phytoene synthase
LVGIPRDVQHAYHACLALAQSHYENFPVASRLLPKALRPHIAAVYAFARTADDYADEPGYEVSERLRLLQEWRHKLHSPSRSRASAEQAVAADDQVFIALHHTIAQFDLPLNLFDDLLDAFTQDVTITRYATWAAVLDYCRRSANPVGRLVLRLSGYRDERLDRDSDAVCTALQLTNFWQDLAIDWSRGRLYVPEEIWGPLGADPDQLHQRALPEPWRRTMGECGRRTRQLFAQGREVCDGVGGRLRYELRATWLGGTRILDRLESAGYDVFTSRPALGTTDALVIACETLLWRKTLWRETPPSPTRS